MAFLILPPAQFIADHQEIPSQIKQQAQADQQSFLQDLRVGSLLSKVNKGAYAGTQIFSWQEKYTGILITSFFYQKGQAFKKEWLKTATLIRQEDCLHLGSLWKFSRAGLSSFSLEDSNFKISSLVSRDFDSISPVKINLQTNMTTNRFADLLNLVLLEEFSKKKVPVLSNIGNFFCKAEKLDVQPLTHKQDYPAKPHKIVKLTLTESSKNSKSFKINYEMEMSSALFGQKSKEFFEKKENLDFIPEKIAQNCVQKIMPALQDMTQPAIKITKRVGSWVYLNRGRAYGLSIGARLVGSHNAKLHIIRYDSAINEEMDGSVAFIRHEDKTTPLAIGDSVTISSPD